MAAGKLGWAWLLLPLLAAGVSLQSLVGETQAFPALHERQRPVVIFFAGLEGSGHSFLESLMKTGGVPVVDFPDSHWECGTEWSEDGKPIVLSHLLKLKPGVYTFPTIRSFPECGSFPIRHDGRKRLYHPRIDWMKEVCDKANVEFRVIFLYRKMEESLASTCIKRVIENCVMQVDVLKANAAILMRQLKALSPRDVQCVEYGDRETMELAFKQAFKGASNVSEDQVISKFKPKNNLGNLSMRFPAWPQLVKEMVPEDGALRALCHDLEEVNLVRLVDLVRAPGLHYDD